MCRLMGMGCRLRCERTRSCQAGRTQERHRFRGCRAVSARVHAMEAAGLSDDAISLEEDEDLALETAKIIVCGDTAKLRQLGVDLEFLELATSGFALSRWVPRFWGVWQHEQNTSAGSAGTSDVASTRCTQFTRPRR